MGRLLDLTVQDFKSYKGHQLIGPFHDFTAVIGPNGSGKSNLMDAISFVLGVKSSQLRSSQLKELVFRPDAGQEGPDTCFVACRYEHDGTTTEFKRTVTAAGSSEYRIDNKLSSFQAYLAQLEKYGILVKSRNFLVFQGDVEQVASQSPKDLTRLIEQISGSLELKEEYDRLQALQEKATEASSLNFNRKRTMHADLKQFKEKKDEAARFKKLQTKKQNLVQTKITCQLYHIEQRVANLQQDIQTENSQSIQSESEKAKFESQMKAAKKTYAKANKEVLLLEKTLKTKKAEQRTMQPDVLQAEEKVRHAESKTKTSEEHISTAQESITRQEAQVESLQRDLGHVIKALEAHEALGTSKAAHPDLGQAQMKEFDKLSSQVDAETVNERTKIKALKRQTHASREGINRIQESIQAQKLRQTALKQEKTALELQSGKFSSSVNSTRSDLKEIQAKRKEIDLEQKRLCQLELEVNEKLDETVNGLLQAKVDQQETRRHKQFKETLERLARLFPGVQGRLLDLCKPSQRKYDLAVSIILGKNMDAIVVNNEKTALECIRYMREQRCGHATFIPLDTIQAKPVAEKYRTFCKGARLAIDVIQFEPQSERAVHYAVGNAVVSDTMETARYICYEKQQQVKVVTLSGTIIHKTGMITGGYSDINNAKRWEEKELERLQHSRQTLTAQLDDIQKAKRKAHHTEDFLSQMTQLEIKYDKLQEDLTATQQKLASVNLELVHIRSVLEGLEEDLERAQEPAQEIQDEIDQAQAIINECQDRLFASFCTQIGVVDIRDFNQRKLSSTQNAAQKRLEYSTSKARLESALLFEQERLDECRGRLTRLLERDQEIQNNKAEMSQELAKFDLGSKQLQADSALIGHRLEESRKKLEQQGEALLRAKQESQEFENFSETIYKNISRLVSFILSRNRRLRRKLQNRWPCFANVS